jgi:DNA ligase-4
MASPICCTSETVISSFILKVKAAEITPTGAFVRPTCDTLFSHASRSDQYHMGVTMRFPRSIGMRDDLDITDCATVSGE